MICGGSWTGFDPYTGLVLSRILRSLEIPAGVGAAKRLAIAMVRHFSDANKPIGTMCHGPQVLAAAGILSGRTLAAYPGVRPEVERAGAKYVEANKSMSNASVDRNLASAPAWPGNPELLKQFLNMLGTKITS